MNSDNDNQRLENDEKWNVVSREEAMAKEKK